MRIKLIVSKHVFCLLAIFFITRNGLSLQRYRVKPKVLQLAKEAGLVKASKIICIETDCI